MCARDFRALGGQKRELQAVVSPPWCASWEPNSGPLSELLSAVPSLQPRAVLIYYLLFSSSAQFPSLYDRQFYTVSSSEHSLPPLADVSFFFLFLLVLNFLSSNRSSLGWI